MIRVPYVADDLTGPPGFPACYALAGVERGAPLVTQFPSSTGKDSPLAHALEREVTLCELLDRVLNKGTVLTGEIVISVADIELLYVSLSLVLSSVETLLEAMDTHKTDRDQRHETS